MKLITGLLCIGISQAAKPTEEQITFLKNVSNNIEKIVGTAKTQFANFKDKSNTTAIETHINGFVDTINSIKGCVIKPLEQVQTRGPEDTFSQAALLFKEIVEQLVIYLSNIHKAIADGNKVPYSRAKAKTIAEKIQNAIEQIKRNNTIKDQLAKIEKLRNYLIEMNLPILADQTKQIHDLCQKLISEKSMTNSEKLAFVTAIERKLRKH